MEEEKLGYVEVRSVPSFKRMHINYPKEVVMKADDEEKAEERWREKWREVLKRAHEEEEAKRWGWMAGVVGAVEGVTGLDVDGDGMVVGIVVGERPKPKEEEPQEQGAGWLSGITNTIESATGLDIDGDGTAGGQKPKQPWQPKQTKSFVSYAAWPKGEPRFVSYGAGAAKPQASQNWLAWLM